MSSILVCYATGEGQTAKVAERIADRLQTRGHEATTVDVDDAAPVLASAEYDALAVGASIHVGTHQDAITSFVSRSADALEALPTAFFQVSLSSASDDPERRAEAAAYVDDLLEATAWDPDRVGLFGGALRYSKYGFLKRLMMKQIAAEATGDTDTSRDYEYTDWAEVDAFADDFAAFVEDRLGDPAPRAAAAAGDADVDADESPDDPSTDPSSEATR